MAGIKRRAILRPRKCRVCDAEFKSRSSKKIYCDECARAREREADRLRANRKSREKGMREIGSEQSCDNCAALYILEAGPQRHCQSCKDTRLQRWKKQKLETDAKFALTSRIRRRINESLGRGVKSGRSWSSLVGYTLEELMAHLERQFLPGMTWENRSDWHIDHIRPVASFNYDSPDDPEFKECWALTNLQPLWAFDNRSKQDKILHLL